jgi:hypothetical protein
MEPDANPKEQNDEGVGGLIEMTGRRPPTPGCRNYPALVVGPPPSPAPFCRSSGCRNSRPCHLHRYLLITHPGGRQEGKLAPRLGQRSDQLLAVHVRQAAIQNQQLWGLGAHAGQGGTAIGDAFDLIALCLQPHLDEAGQAGVILDDDYSG